MQDGIVPRIDEFCNNLMALYATDTSISTVEPMYGKKYCRIALVYRGIAHEVIGKSVYCFIDLSNGDILKTAGWAGPAKGKRGSIWNPDCDVGADKPANLYGGGLYR